MMEVVHPKRIFSFLRTEPLEKTFSSYRSTSLIPSRNNGECDCPGPETCPAFLTVVCSGCRDIHFFAFSHCSARSLGFPPPSCYVESRDRLAEKCDTWKRLNHFDPELTVVRGAIQMIGGVNSRVPRLPKLRHVGRQIAEQSFIGDWHRYRRVYSERILDIHRRWRIYRVCEFRGRCIVMKSHIWGRS